MPRAVDTREDAVGLFETFTARQSRREIRHNFTWPRAMQEVGVAKAQLYRSNKWKSDLKEYEDYKHVAEAPQRLYVRPGWLKLHPASPDELRANPGLSGPPRAYGPIVTLPPVMPRHFAQLAPLLGLQAQLYTGMKGGDGVLTRNSGFCQIEMAHGFLGGAKDPETEEAFLLVYTKDGVCAIITGDSLDIRKEGITG